MTAEVRKSVSFVATQGVEDRAVVRKSVGLVATQGVEDRAVVRKSVAYILAGPGGEAAVRKSVAYIVIGLDTSGNLTGGEAVWREGDETNIAPHVDISQPMQVRLTDDYINTGCTLLVMYSDGSFERRFVTPDQSPWTVPVTGEINQLAFFKGELVPVTIEAIRRGMVDRRFESDESDPVDPDPEPVNEVTFVDGVSLDNQTSNDSRSLTLNTHQEGDLLFAMLGNRGVADPPNLLTGWNDLGGQTAGTGINRRAYRLQWKIAESASETITWNGAYGFLVAFQNAVHVMPRARLVEDDAGSPLPFPPIYELDTSGKGAVLAGGVGSSDFTGTEAPYDLLAPSSTSNRFAGIVLENTDSEILTGALIGSNFRFNTWAVHILPFVPDPVTAPEGAWLFDTQRTQSGYDTWNAGQTVVNAVGGSNLTGFVPTENSFTTGKRYWEVKCSGGIESNYDGYMGVVTSEHVGNWGSDNPVFDGSIGYRGNGSLWSDDGSSGNEQVSNLASFGPGDILMFCFDASTRSIWVGKNGVWEADPDADAAIYSAGVGSEWYPFVQGRNPNEGGTLLSLESQFNYSIPSSAVALAT